MMIIKQLKATLFSLLVFTSLTGFFNPVFAAPPKDAKKIAEHLEFLGFTSKIDNDTLEARKPRNFPIYAEDSSLGIRFSLALPTNSNAIANKARLIEILNKLNSESFVTKFHLSNENDIVFEAIYTGDYNKQEFGNFMQAYLSDYDLVYQNSELDKYIGN